MVLDLEKKRALVHEFYERHYQMKLRDLAEAEVLELYRKMRGLEDELYRHYANSSFLLSRYQLKKGLRGTEP